MRTLTIAAVVSAALTIAAPASAHHPHFKGCRTDACDQRVSYPHQAHDSRVHHLTPDFRWAWTITPFDRCVYMRESAGVRTATNGSDFSYYQWEDDAAGNTWTAAEREAGVYFTEHPVDATLEQQTYVFNLYEPHHPTAWPSTVPACGYLT